MSVTKILFLKNNVLYLLVLFLLPMHASSDAEITTKGRNSYLALRANTEEGSDRANCMKGAFSQLNATCASLNDTLVSFLALKFTVCHYRSTRRELPRECTAAIPTPESAPNCTNALTESAFIIYTQFLTHTLASCYFLEARLWQERAERTILKLGDVAIKSADKIEMSLSQSAELIRGQTILQTKASQLNDKHDTLHGKIDQNHHKMDQLSKTINDYYTMISDILFGLSLSSARLEQLINLVLGETQQLSSFLFYLSLTVITFVLTVPSRTSGARLRIISVVVIHFLLERLLFSVTYSVTPDFHPIFAGIAYYTRLSLVMVSLVLLLHTGYHYRDYEMMLSAISSQLDLERRENEKFREDIQNEIKISNTSLHDKLDRIGRPYLSPKAKEQLIPMGRCSIHRARRRLDDDFAPLECSTVSTPFKSCPPVSARDLFSASEYDSGVEDCVSRRELQLSIPRFDISTAGSSCGPSPASTPASTPTRAPPPLSLSSSSSSSSSRYHLRQRK